MPRHNPVVHQRGLLHVHCLQDIVTASPHFSIEGFIPRLRDYLRVTNPYKRQFLISWVGSNSSRKTQSLREPVAVNAAGAPAMIMLTVLAAVQTTTQTIKALRP